MSFHPFFPGDGAPDLPDHHQPPNPDEFHPYAPRPTRPAPPHPSTIDALLTDPPQQQQQQRQSWYPTQEWQPDTTYYDVFNNATAASAGFPDATSQGTSSYLPPPPPPKIELPAHYRTSYSTSPSRYTATNTTTSYLPTASSAAAFLDPPGIYSSDYHEHGLEMTGHHHTSVDIVKEEPHTPTGSPQFIFEFPGGDDAISEPPPFELPRSTPSISFPGDRAPSALSRCSESTPPPFSGERPTTRPGSPTTEAMRSMMSTFRVDPFASYVVDAGSRRKRRKRGSTYALLTDPEASSREEPLMFTFQLDVPGMETDDLNVGSTLESGALSNDWGVGFEMDVGGSGGGGGGGGGTAGGGSDIYAELDVPLEMEGVDAEVDYDVYGPAGTEDDVPYRLQHASFDNPTDDHSHSPSTNAYTHTHSSPSTLVTSTYTSAYQDLILSCPPTTSLSRHSTPESLDSPPLSSHPELGLDPEPDFEILPSAPIPPAPLSPPLSSMPSIVRMGMDSVGGRYRPPTKMHICWICQKEFPRPSGLATHMNTHSGLKPYKCPVPACSKTFAVRSNARRHLRIHGALFSDQPPHPHPNSTNSEASTTTSHHHTHPSNPYPHSHLELDSSGAYVYPDQPESEMESSPSAESLSGDDHEVGSGGGLGGIGLDVGVGIEMGGSVPFDFGGDEDVPGGESKIEGIHDEWVSGYKSLPLPDAPRTAHAITLGANVITAIGAY